MKKLWALLFLSVPVWGVGLFLIAATSKRETWWWPEPLSSFGQPMDNYFWAITAVTTVTFVATTGLLGYFMLKYTDDRPGRASNMSHSTALEASWTIGTVIILICVSAPQIDDWERLKVSKHMPTQEVFAEVTGRQFEWRIRYPGKDGALNTLDDVWAPPSEFHFYKDVPCRINLRSDDVLHSFFLPELRIKQDAVPGSTIPVWFDSNRAGTYDLICAELCGWGHYKMRGKIVIHETKAEFESWLDRQRAEQEASR